MKIIIAGAGKVGYNLAKNLSLYHDVTVIDKNEEAVGRISEELDILPVCGDIEDPRTYMDLNIKEIDLFIAVTNLDEANMLSLFIAEDHIHAAKRIIRLKNTFFKKTKVLQKLNVFEAVYPLSLTTKKIEKLLKFPKANNVKSFSYTKAKLISVRIVNGEDTTIFPKKFLEDYENVIAVGVERDKRFMILDENDVIKTGDLVYFFGKGDEIKRICSSLETKTPEIIKKCVIYGAADLGIEIAKALTKKDMQIKIIEKDTQLCRKASEILEGNVTIINSKYSSHQFFTEERLKDADMFISTTRNDEYNIVKCIEAQEAGIKKVISINNDLEYYDLMHRLGIVVVRGTKANAFYSILENIESNGIIAKKKFCGGKATIFLRKIFKNSPLIDKTIHGYPRSKNTFCLIIKDEKIESFYGKTMCKEGDVIAVFALEAESEKVDKWIHNL